MVRAYRWSLIAALAACGPGVAVTEDTGPQSSTGTGGSGGTGGPTPTTGPAESTSTGMAFDTSTSGTGAPSDPSTGMPSAATTGTSTSPADDTSTSTSTSAADDTTTSGSSGESGTSGGAAVYCPQSEWAQDCEPVNCEGQHTPCGSLFSGLDEQGLRRQACPGPDCDCGPGFECFYPYAWGGCAPGVLWCGSQTEDCGGAYCVPDGLGPPFACGGTDEAACVAAGCTFVVAPWVDDGPDDCACGEALPLCLWFPEGGRATAKLTAYYNPLLQQTRLFASEWQQPPFGWKQCAGDPDAPPSCACAEQCAP